MKCWQDRGGNLDHEPTNDRIRYCDLVDVAPLQFGKEVALVHGLLAVGGLEVGVGLGCWRAALKPSLNA